MSLLQGDGGLASIGIVFSQGQVAVNAPHRHLLPRLVQATVAKHKGNHLGILNGGWGRGVSILPQLIIRGSKHRLVSVLFRRNKNLTNIFVQKLFVNMQHHQSILVGSARSLSISQAGKNISSIQIFFLGIQ